MFKTIWVRVGAMTFLLKLATLNEFSTAWFAPKKVALSGVDCQLGCRLLESICSHTSGFNPGFRTWLACSLVRWLDNVCCVDALKYISITRYAIAAVIFVFGHYLEHLSVCAFLGTDFSLMLCRQWTWRDWQNDCALISNLRSEVLEISDLIWHSIVLLDVQSKTNCCILTSISKHF